ncbi:hypothetical protein BDF19DRAFT_450639 [Syncephalis fuscata]|nr:hypothetical protein BDF19DRAFT_450639 [Syncephalis fuscata]
MQLSSFAVFALLIAASAASVSAMPVASDDYNSSTALSKRGFFDRFRLWNSPNNSCVFFCSRNGSGSSGPLSFFYAPSKMVMQDKLMPPKSTNTKLSNNKH